MPIWPLPTSPLANFAEHHVRQNRPPWPCHYHDHLLQTHVFGNVVARGPHLGMQLLGQIHEFATPRCEKPSPAHTTINATMIKICIRQWNSLPPITDVFPPNPMVHIIEPPQHFLYRSDACWGLRGPSSHQTQHTQKPHKKNQHFRVIVFPPSNLVDFPTSSIPKTSQTFLIVMSNVSGEDSAGGIQEERLLLNFTFESIYSSCFWLLLPLLSSNPTIKFFGLCGFWRRWDKGLSGRGGTGECQSNMMRCNNQQETEDCNERQMQQSRNREAEALT